MAGASGEQSALLAGAVDTAKALCNATAMARDLATDRADVVTPLFMAEVAAQVWVCLHSLHQRRFLRSALMGWLPGACAVGDGV